MKVLVLLSLVSVACAATIEQVTTYKYHDIIGVHEAKRIKTLEEATDFDGSRIVGGSLARLGQFPYQAGLVIALTDGRTSVCGGSLLTNTRAVTAAHCWFDGSNQARQFTVVLGSILLFSGGVRVNTNSVQMHGSWNPRNANNDIAIINIAHVGFTANIGSIGLASGTNLFVGTWATASGFGLTRDGGNIPQNQGLSHVSVQVITNAECRRTYLLIVVDSTICTSGAGGRGTCSGDSGGPLAVGNQLIGVTSFGSPRGCQAGLPAGFARVTSFNAWIRARI